jgi:DNA polymerase-3 subunit delta
MILDQTSISHEVETLNTTKTKQQKSQQEIQKVIVCFGTERLLMDEFVQSLIQRFVPADQQDFAVSKYDLRETTLSTIIEDAETLPFMTTSKLIIADHATFLTGSRDTSKSEDSSKKEQQIDDLIAYTQSPSPQTILVFIVNAEKLDDRKKIVKLLKSQDAIKSFYPLKPQEIRSWVKEKAEQSQLSLTEDAIDLLIDQTSRHLYIISSEIDKLRLLLGPHAKVEASLVQQFVSRSLEQNVFLLVDRVVMKRIDEALSMFYDLLRLKEEPIKILILIARQFRIMLQVKQLSLTGLSQVQMASQIGAAPYAVQIAHSQARSYETHELQHILANLSEFDYQMKTGKIDKVLGLELFLLKIGS